MIGLVDNSTRALLEISVGKEPASPNLSIISWIDTTFDGQLVFSHELISELELESLVQTDAILADGSRITLETFLCYLDWFDRRIPVQVIANEGEMPLLGTGLLDGHVLHVDFVQKQLSLN